MTDREERIREIAYPLWALEGRPEGRSDSHWFEAVSLYESEMSGRAVDDLQSASHPSAEANSDVENLRSFETATPVPPAQAPGARPNGGKPVARPARSSGSRPSVDNGASSGEQSST